MLVFLTAAALAAQPSPYGGGAPDAETRDWWALASELSSDAYEGRRSGTAGYERAAAEVARRLEVAGLWPAGEEGSYFQRVPIEEIEITYAEIRAPGGTLAHLDEFVVEPSETMWSGGAWPLAYRGYCGADVLGEVKEQVVVCHGTRRDGLPNSNQRENALKAAGAVGMIEIADPGFSIEPPRWPYAYNIRQVRDEADLPRELFLDITLNADALGKLFPERDAAALIEAGAKGEALPNFDGGPMRWSAVQRRSTTSTPNVLAILPGTDPALRDRMIVMGAHLDSYGFGRAVEGDPLYNGTLDNAAYVALLLKLIEDRGGKGFARPVLFAFWAGEEFGLHGSRHFVANPTRPLEHIAATLNLDQLRPIFPLERLTTHGRSDSDLGAMAEAVAARHGFVLQDDPEPVRNMILRTDHRPFMEAGIPFLNFTFGFEPGSESEAIYRHWYRTGYHKPQDDPAQLMDWEAAKTFNDFWLELATAVADRKEPIVWNPDSRWAPRN